MDWLVVVLLFALLFVLLVFMIKRRSERKIICPHCGSLDIVEIDRKVVDSRTVEYIGSGTPAGGDIRLQLDLELTYRCNNCGKQFKVERKETS